MKPSKTTSWINHIRNKMENASCKGISQYQQLAEAFLAAIDAGVLPAGTRLPPDAKLAEQLGFSHITLGRALNELRKQDIVERSRAHGTSIAADLSVREEPRARTVAILFDDINPSTFNIGLFQQLYNYLSEKEYKILFLSAGGSGREQAEQLMDQMKHPQCVGAIVWSIMSRTDTERVLSVKPSFWPLVFLNTMFNPESLAVDTVIYDNFTGFRDIAVQYWRSTGRKIIFASRSDLLKGSLHNDYYKEITQAIGEENVKVFTLDRDSFQALVHRADRSLLLTFDYFRDFLEAHNANRLAGLEPYVLSCAHIEPQDDGFPTLTSSAAELAKLAVNLLDRRIKSPQSAYRHERTSFRLFNMDKIFPAIGPVNPLRQKGGKNSLKRKTGKSA